MPGIDKVVMGVWTSDALARLPNPMSSNFRAMPIAGIAAMCPAEPCLAGVSPQAYTAAVEAPNAHANIHIANNDYTWTMEQDVPCCWAEQSLKSVERTLHKAWGLARSTTLVLVILAPAARVEQGWPRCETAPPVFTWDRSDFGISFSSISIGNRESYN